MSAANALDFVPARRAVTAEHLKFVEANRHRMGWQALAACCGVNQTDLRRRCDAGFVEVAAAEPAAKPPLTGSVRDAVDPLKVLRAILKGARSCEDLADACGIGVKHAGRVVTRLRQCGWLAGHGRSFAGWLVTDAGYKALKTPPRP
jgi:hypothetical protein